MKYIEAKKQIKALSSKYYISMSDGDFTVNYKNKIIAWVKVNVKYSFYKDEERFKNMPFNNKLYMILAELAITPLDERAEEKKYYVKIFNNEFGYLNVKNLSGKATADDKSETDSIKTKFTDKEIEQLKQRDDIALDWNKVTLEEAE